MTGIVWRIDVVRKSMISGRSTPVIGDILACDLWVGGLHYSELQNCIPQYGIYGRMIEASTRPSLHVLVRREDIDASRLGGRVVVVIDVLFATSTIAHALASGASMVYPAIDADDARRAADARPGALVAGEYLAQTLPEHAPATPLALAACLREGSELVYFTTNGTRAIAACHGAAAVYAGALTNAAALATHITAAHPGVPVLLVCAGSVGRLCLEDFIGAGHLVRALRANGDYAITDAAMAAAFAVGGADIDQLLNASRVGRMLSRAGLDDEIAHAAACDSSAIVPVLRDGVLVRASA